MKHGLWVIAVLFGTFSWAAAQSVYVTNEPGEALEQVDISSGPNAGTITPLYSIGGRPDSIILNSSGQIIYSVTPAGVVNLYNPKTGVNTTLASGLSHPRDLVFDPNGNTLLIALYSPGGIVRLNLVTGTVTTLAKKLGTVDGLAYDPAGRLFAVANHNTVVQIDPNTGAVLKTLVLEPHYKTNGGDGMVYDPYTQHLWVSHDGTLGNGLIEIPTDLSTFTEFQTGNIKVPDGIVSDSQGNLYIGSGLWDVVVYHIPTDTITQTFKVKGVDSLVLIPGSY